MKRSRWGFRYLIFLMISAAWSAQVRNLILERSSVSFLKTDFYKNEDFREMDVPEKLSDDLRENVPEEFAETELLTLVMLNGHFHPDKAIPDLKELAACRRLYLKYKPQEYHQLLECFQAVWADVEYFPLAQDDADYQNSWLEFQDYEGSGPHQGTDLTGTAQKPGYDSVISMTAGVVESMDWTPEYGNQIVIRAVHGGYFSYAHLFSYEKDFQKGKSVSAGDILGFMGNTGTVAPGKYGELPVFLHVGISVSSPEGILYSINPYAVLKCAGKKIRIYNIH